MLISSQYNFIENKPQFNWKPENNDTDQTLTKAYSHIPLHTQIRTLEKNFKTKIINLQGINIQTSR